MTSKIEQIVSEIEDYINRCRFKTFSKKKVIVNKDEMEELLAELRLSIPDEVKKYNEIKKYKQIIANREAIIDNAKQKAGEIIREAKENASKLLSENEIIKQAYVQAIEIVQKAENEK